MSNHPGEPRRPWSASGSEPNDGTGQQARRRPRPVGSSSLWDEQGSPSIHAADVRVPPAGRPSRTRRGTGETRQPDRGVNPPRSASRQQSPRQPSAQQPSAQQSSAQQSSAQQSSAQQSSAQQSSAQRDQVRRESAQQDPARRSATRQRSAPQNSGRRPAKRRPPVRRFGAGNRWRAILIPVLVLLTVVVIFQVTAGPDQPVPAADAGSESVRPTAPASSVVDAASPDAGAPATLLSTVSVVSPATPGAVPDLTINDADGHLAGSIMAAALPAGPDFVPAAAGTWHVVPGSTPPVGAGERRYTYTVEVEDGLQAVEQDVAFATAVDATLADPRSWIGGGQVTLNRIDSGDPDFRISLTSQLTIRSPDQCGWEVPLEASCFNGYADRVFINDARWVRGAMSYGGDLDGYRSYAVNHEVGHALGMRHEPCPATGQPAPVMMQQSWSTSDDDLTLLDPQTIPRDGHVCVANPYPFPGAIAAPPVSPAPTAAAG